MQTAAYIPTTGTALLLRRLTLSNFRCYDRARLDLDARPVVLTGPNGAGKTNLLEAVSYLTPGRGLRRAKLRDVVRRAQGSDVPAVGDVWGVSATILAEDGEIEVGTGLAPGQDADDLGERRLVKIDGAMQRSQTALSRCLNAVWLTPDMDRLFADGASARRRFLDRLVYGFDADHAGRLNAYDQALRERNRLLDPAGGMRRDDAWLSALEDRIAAAGVSIAAARADVVARLNAACAMTAGAFPAAALALVGEVEGWLNDLPAIEVEDRLRDRLAQGRALDAAAGRALIGPHRSDLAVRHVVKDAPAETCSTGEQKTLLIGIVLANARLHALGSGSVPVLLLDEITAHLDAAKRAALFGEILELGAQAWMTGTDRALFDPFGDRAQHFRVEDAHVAAL